MALCMKVMSAGENGTWTGKVPLKQDIVSAGPMPPTPDGNKYILVIQDYFSKWVELFLLKQHSTEDIADILVQEIFTRYGICEHLHSDQGAEFNSHLMKEVCKLWQIKKTRTSPYAPWSNGMVERSNKSIKRMLKQHATEVWGDTWVSKLPIVRMALNNTKHSTTGYTPHKLFFSRCEDAVLPGDLLYGRRSWSSSGTVRSGECWG